MKFIRITLTSIILVAALLVSVPPAQAACGDNYTHGKCGEAGGCPDGKICNDYWWYGSECIDPKEGQCENVNTTRAACGQLNTDGWCGETGGCASGYLCDADNMLCVEEKTGCTNTSNTYQKQCGGRGTVNACGSEGACAYGYRCVGVNSKTSGTGYACLDMQDNDGNYCPGSPNASQPVETIICDVVTSNPNAKCSCAATGNELNRMLTPGNYCCGYVAGDECYPSREDYEDALEPEETPIPPIDVEPDPEEPKVGVGTTSGDGGGSGDSGSPPLDIFAGPNSQDFSDLNPLRDSTYVGDLSSPGGIISRVLLFAFPIAGLILFLMLVWAGFEILSKAPSGKSIDAGKQRATAAIVGFILLFCTYWIMQIVEYVFGIVVL